MAVGQDEAHAGGAQMGHLPPEGFHAAGFRLTTGEACMGRPCRWRSLRLCGSGEWPVERHGSRTRRLWRKLHLATDADTGEIIVAELTGHDIDDGGQIEALLDRCGGPIASFTAGGAYDRDDVYAAVAARSPRAAVVISPRSSAVLSVEHTDPTQRDAHIAAVAAHGCMG